jgi:DNA-binding IclR family transcriptional regulator
MIPAFTDAKRDRALRGNPMTVYLNLMDVLDPVEWRPIKRLALCAELEIGKTAVAEALDTLVSRGYVELDTSTRAGAGQPRRYRLYYRRHVTALDSKDPAA